MFTPAATGSGESLLVISRSAWGVTVSVSVALLFAGVGSVPSLPSSATEAVFATDPEAVGRTVTAKVLDPLAPPPDKPPMESVQVVPAGAPSAQLQPAELAPALNTVLDGTVSVSVMPVAPWFPTLA